MSIYASLNYNMLCHVIAEAVPGAITSSYCACLSVPEQFGAVASDKGDRSLRSRSTKRFLVTATDVWSTLPADVTPAPLSLPSFKRNVKLNFSSAATRCMRQCRLILAL